MRMTGITAADDIREKLRLKPKSGYALGLELRQRGVSSRIIEEVLAENGD